MLLAMRFQRENRGNLSRKRNDSVEDVVTDVRAAAEADAGTLAPLLDDGRLVAPEIRVVAGNIPYPSKP